MLNQRQRILSISCLALSLLVITAGAADAWEFAYGPPNSVDSGYRRVVPVTSCPQGPSYIAVGTHAAPANPANPDVYVVLTNAGGGRRWEFTYEIQGAGLPDEGIAVVEVPGGQGFVVLSNTTVAGSWAPALMAIDCFGNVKWSKVYPDFQNRSLVGRDLIRAATPAPGGQLVVAGYWSENPPSTDTDAFLMRTSATGGLLWDKVYDTEARETLEALTEAEPPPGAIDGDLVAVGTYIGANQDPQGFVMRVFADGTNGPNFCMAHHGGPLWQEGYQSVIQLVTPPNQGLFAITGYSIDANWQSDVLVTLGNPCTVVSQSLIGDDWWGITNEVGHSVREILLPLPGGPVPGDLAITGYASPQWPGPADAFLLAVQVPLLAPILGNLFGDHGDFNEVGISLAQNPAGFPAGFVIAGWTETDWQWVGDPADLYLVGTLNGGGWETACSVPWWPQFYQAEFPVTEVRPQWRRVARKFKLETQATEQDSAWLICP